jgi:hypothetical protein
LNTDPTEGPIRDELTTLPEKPLNEENLSSHTETQEALMFIGSQYETELALIGDFNQYTMFFDFDQLAKEAGSTLNEELCKETPDFIFDNTERIIALIDDVLILFEHSAVSLLPSSNPTVPCASAQALLAVGWQGTSNFIREDPLHLHDCVHPLDPLQSLPSSRTWPQLGTLSDIETRDHFRATDPNVMLDILDKAFSEFGSTLVGESLDDVDV